MLQTAPKIEADELATALSENLRAQRSALLGLRHDGIISQDVYNELTAEIDNSPELVYRTHIE